jgi:copper resistance protein D
VELGGWDAATLVVNAITYASTLCSAGIAGFLVYSNELLRDIQRKQFRRLCVYFVGIAAASSIARVALLGGSMSGDFSGMFDGEFTGMILRSAEGNATGLRLAGLAIIAMSVANRRWQSAGAIGGIIAAISFAWIGHAHAMRPNTAPTLLLCLHLVCAAFWLGALPPLLVIARESDTGRIAAIAARFGKIAIAAVALLIFAGAGLLWLMIGSATEFWSSAYGRMMALKLFMVALILSLAAFNKLHLTVRLSHGDAGAAGMFRRSVKAEMALGGLVLLVTAAFTTIVGPP